MSQPLYIIINICTWHQIVQCVEKNVNYPMNNLKNFSDALSIYSLKLKSLEFLKHIGGGDK